MDWREYQEQQDRDEAFAEWQEAMKQGHDAAKLRRVKHILPFPAGSDVEAADPAGNLARPSEAGDFTDER